MSLMFSLALMTVMISLISCGKKEKEIILRQVDPHYHEEMEQARQEMEKIRKELEETKKIKGRDGRDGVDGKDGEKGDKGDKGEDGIDGKDGRDCTYDKSPMATLRPTPRPRQKE